MYTRRTTPERRRVVFSVLGVGEFAEDFFCVEVPVKKGKIHLVVDEDLSKLLFSTEKSINICYSLLQ